MMKASSSRHNECEGRVKYTALKISEDSINCESVSLSETSPLLENVETLMISPPVGTEYVHSTPVKTEYVNSTAVKNEHVNSTPVKNEHVNSTPVKTEHVNSTPLKNEHVISTSVKNEQANSTPMKTEHANSTPVTTERVTENHENDTETRPEAETDSFIDIVRKRSQSKSDTNVHWRVIGPYHTIKLKKCQRLYADTSTADDLALFFHNGKFYVMNAWCSHMGAPLYDGDIEDYNGKCHVMCPWHSYMYDLETGKNEIGLQQKVCELMYNAGQIYVKYHTNVNIEPPPIVKDPVETKRNNGRKDSVLDSPLQLGMNINKGN